MHKGHLRKSFMSLQKFLLVFLCCLPKYVIAQHNATIVIRGSVVAAETDENFVCATLDWWPPQKCNYGHCTWGQASILNLDVNHPFLVNAIQAFKNLRIRVGGSLQDQVTYEVPGFKSKCPPFTKEEGGLFGFSKGCLSISRWNKVNILFKKTGAIVTFGLNALQGRHHGSKKGLWTGAWNSSNARKFMEYTLSHGYPVDSWEFGNELSGHGIGARVEYEQYAKDLIELKVVIEEVYKSSSSRPMIVAPGGFFEKIWYGQLLKASGTNTIKAMSHHIYNLGAGNDPHLVDKIIDPKHLNGMISVFSELKQTIQTHGPWSSAWVSESGGAFNSGGGTVSNTFIDSFWYLDQLGMAAKYGTKVYCRQALIGGYYGLLDYDSFLPNPDYYSALLWHRLMGKRVLSTGISGAYHLRAYAHCRKQGPGISLVLINLSKETKFQVAVKNDGIDTMDVSIGGSFLKGLKRTFSWIARKPYDFESTKREEYHLTAKDGHHRSHKMLLNGKLLELATNGSVPTMNPILAAANSPVVVSPLSIAFVVFPKFQAQACS